jgi:transketolase
MLKPIEIKSRLFDNPTQQPFFKTEIQTPQGSVTASDPKALRALVALMDMNAVLGGAAAHYGGPAALAEIVSSLHALVFEQSKKAGKKWHELFHIVNDAGHCENVFYALKANYKTAGLDFESLKKFRSIESPLTGHGEVHCFPEGVLLSNGPLGSALPQTQGLALADKLSGQNRVTISIVSDGASMEGEAKEAFAAIPGLAKAGHLAPYVMIISDNNTKLSGRIDKESFSMEPTFKGLEDLGWKRIIVAEGNNLQKCYSALLEAVELARQNPQQPIVIHAKTVKGIGTKKTVEAASGGHGFPLKKASEMRDFISEIYGSPLPEMFEKWIGELASEEQRIAALGKKDEGEKIQKGIASAMIRIAKEGLPIVSVSADLAGSTGVEGFRKEFPQQSFDIGVAESNMVSTAAGLSRMGFIPVVDTFAQFGVTKGALPLTMAALSEAPVMAVYSHTGFQDAADGASHQALSYISMAASIPHVKVYCLSCSEEADALFYQAAKEFASERAKGKTPSSYVFFLGRENFPKTYVSGASYKLDQAQVLKIASGTKKVLLATTGSLVPYALKASEELEKKGISAAVINCSSVNHIDLKTVSDALKNCDQKMITVEDHQLLGGFGQLLTHALLQNGVSFKVKSLGVRGEFGRSAYTANELYSAYGIDSKAIVKAALELQ